MVSMTAILARFPEQTRQQESALRQQQHHGGVMVRHLALRPQSVCCGLSLLRRFVWRSSVQSTCSVCHGPCVGACGRTPLPLRRLRHPMRGTRSRAARRRLLRWLLLRAFRLASYSTSADRRCRQHPRRRRCCRPQPQYLRHHRCHCLHLRHSQLRRCPRRRHRRFRHRCRYHHPVLAGHRHLRVRRLHPARRRARRLPLPSR